MTPTNESNGSVNDATAHETQFVGGVVRCTCGWKSARLCWSIREVDEEAGKHLEAVQ